MVAVAPWTYKLQGGVPESFSAWLFDQKENKQAWGSIVKMVVLFITRGWVVVDLEDNREALKVGKLHVCADMLVHQSFKAT